jgi:hypothetical protein
MVDPPEVPMTDVATKPDSGQLEEEQLDADLLEEARRQLAAASPNAVLNEALRRLVAQERQMRRAARAAAQRMADDGLLDFSKLDTAEQ